jgi:DNA repair exonuclease SbcCD ATPase subunit
MGRKIYEKPHEAKGIKDVFNRLRGKDTRDLTKRLNDLADMINKYNAKAEKQEQRLKEILREIDDIKKDVSGIKKHDEQQDSKIKDLSNKPTVQLDEIKPRPVFLNDITKPSQLKPVELNKKIDEPIPEWQKILNERRKDIEPDEPEDDESEDWGAGITKRMSLKEYLEMIN